MWLLGWWSSAPASARSRRCRPHSLTSQLLGGQELGLLHLDDDVRLPRATISPLPHGHEVSLSRRRLAGKHHEKLSAQAFGLDVLAMRLRVLALALASWPAAWLLPRRALLLLAPAPARAAVELRPEAPKVLGRRDEDFARGMAPRTSIQRTPQRPTAWWTTSAPCRSGRSSSFSGC